jgi:hypothetical protein
MFPNFRLMIATTLASVVAMIFGFAAFAALHVNHGPLMRVSRIGPMQLIGGNTSMPSIAAIEPFNDRFRFGGPGSHGDFSALAYSNSQLSDGSGAQTEARATDIRENEAAEAEPAPSDGVDAVAALRPNAAPQTPGETKSDEAVAAASAPAPTPGIANAAPPAADLPAEPVQPAEQSAAIELAPSSSIDELAARQWDMDMKAAEKKSKHAHARVHRIRGVRAVAVAKNSPAPGSGFPSAIGGPFVVAPKR